MKKTVWSFGLLSAALSIVMMAVTLPFIRPGRYTTADVLGYTSIVLSALLVFFGVRSYREGAGGGRLTLGRGLIVGVLIPLRSTLVYAAACELVYFKLVPDFGERFAAGMLHRVREAGGTPEAVAATEQQARTLKRLYDHPGSNAALT